MCSSIRTSKTSPADVSIVDGGSVFLFRLLTAQAREWVHTFVSADRLMFGDGVVVEHRFAMPLAAAMQDAGFVLTVEAEQ
jgi:hypothetical protein